MAFVGNVTAAGNSAMPVAATLYGTCTTAAATQAKVVTCAAYDLATPITGMTIVIKFTNTNTYNGTVTLNINSKGAKNAYRYGTTNIGTTVQTSWPAGAAVSFTFDGTNWILTDPNYDTNSNTTYSAGTGLALSSTTFNHSNSVTAGTAGTSSATSGSTLAVPYVTYDAQGHVTASGTHTHTVSGFAASNHTHSYLPLSGGTMSGGISMVGNRIYWKENNYGDQFAIVPYFSGADDANLLKIQSAVGDQGTTPDMTDKITISGKTGNVNITTGSLTVKSNVSFSGSLLRNDSTHDLKQSNNGVSSTSWPGFSLKDKNGYTYSGFYSSVGNDGKTGTGMWVYNRNSAGEQVTSGSIAIYADKAGNITYAVTNPANFRSAISAAASSHTHNYAGSSAAGGDATRALAVKDAGNNNNITIQYSGDGISTASWFCAWDGYKIRAISAANTRSAIGAAASSHTHNYITNQGRLTTADNLRGDGNLRFTLASSSMTTSKPLFGGNGAAAAASDGQIIELPWDNTGGYDVQLAIKNNGSALSIRGGTGKEGNAQKWTTWAPVAMASSAISNITRSGTTFTATRADGTTFTFTQQDNNTTYTAGTGLSLSSNKFSVSTIPIANGGTGQTTRVAGMNALSNIGNNAITSTANDTTAKWGAFGNGVSFYSATGQLTDQPTQYGYLINISPSASSEVHQIWTTQASGNIYHRGGNSAGWSGTWRKVLDSANTTISTATIKKPSAGTAIAADDITAWTTNTPTVVTKKTVVTAASGATASISNGLLTLTNGSFTTGDSCTVTAGKAATLSYTARSIPNISLSDQTVVTGVTIS